MIKDLVFGLRSLRRAPAFTLTALVVLALGIGANSAIFSVVSPILFKPLPFPDPEKVVSVTPVQRASQREWSYSWLSFHDVAQRQHSFEALAAFTRDWVAMSTEKEPMRVLALYASPELFGVTKLPPALGRNLQASDEEPGAAPVAMLSQWAWRRYFGGEAGVLGREVLLDGRAVSIVGVTSEALKLPNVDPGLYLPLHLNADVIKFGQHRGHRHLQVVGRVNGTLDAARTDLEAVFASIEKEHPSDALRPNVVPLKERMVGDQRPAALALFAAVLLVLLIACANVAGLQLVRAGTRQREVAIRLALGASRARVVRQMLTESVLLGLAGGALSLLVALWTVDALKALGAAKLAGAELDGSVLAFTAVAGVVTGLLFGLLPALHASRAAVHEALKDAGTRASQTRGRRRAQAALIGVQIALAFALLAGAGLMFQSLYALSRVDPGFKHDHLVSVRLRLPDSLYSAERKRAYYRDALEQAARLPGVTGVALADPFPFSDGNSFNSVYAEGHQPEPAQELSAAMYEVNEGYFETMGIPLKEGRSFLPEEQTPENDRTIVVSERLAKQLWPNESALGKRMQAAGPNLRTVIGIVGDVRHGSLDGDPRAAFYVPWQQSGWLTLRLLAKTEGDPQALAPALRKLTRSLDPTLPVPEPDVVSEMVEGSNAPRRLTLVMLAAFAAMALLLSSLGLWGLIAYAVGQRRQELAIRLALGAPHGHVVALVLKQGLWLIGGGILGGVGLALLGSKLLKALLYGVQPVDVLTYAGIAAMLGLVALLACWLPARAATRVDPNAALRA